jgi:hypothetical protein
MISVMGRMRALGNWRSLPTTMEGMSRRYMAGQTLRILFGRKDLCTDSFIVTPEQVITR